MIVDNAVKKLNQCVPTMALGVRRQAGCDNLLEEAALLLHPLNAIEGEVEPLNQFILGDETKHFDFFR